MKIEKPTRKSRQEKGKAIGVAEDIQKKKKRKRKEEETDSETDSDTVQEVDEKARSLSQRIKPKDFINLVIKDLSDEHKKAIENIGFGGLLHLEMGPSKSIWNDKLVRSFDMDRESIVIERNQEIEIINEDAHIVYGLPMGGEIIEEPNDETDEKWAEFLTKWRSLFGIRKGSPKSPQVISEIQRLKRQPVCEEFLWHFILSAVNCCIRSTTNTQLNYKFLYSCMDINKVAKLDWCEFVIRSVKASAEEWQEGSSYFTGPLPFLMVIF